jgi:hypothetical protein
VVQQRLLGQPTVPYWWDIFAPGISRPRLFDGFDIDWESPQEKDAANFLALLEEFRGR